MSVPFFVQLYHPFFLLRVKIGFGVEGNPNDFFGLWVFFFLTNLLF